MHELGIANSILEAARTEADRYPGSHVIKIGIRIGEYAGVDTESLRFCFDAIKRETDLAQAELSFDYQEKGLELELSHLELEESCPK
jgi:hydrogenase nickel incorporation protein HypA/HybF